MSLLYFHRNLKFGSSCIWKIEEQRSFFLDKLKISDQNIPFINGAREMEWLASRLLALKLDKTVPEAITKDEYGKPHCSSGEKHISISHSKNYAAYASFVHPIGIDLQIHDARIRKLAKKYTTVEEVNLLPENLESDIKLHLIWTVKEAVFKLYGRKELPFKTAILIKESSWEMKSIRISGLIKKGLEKYPFCSISRIIKDFYFTTAVFEGFDKFN